MERAGAPTIVTPSMVMEIKAIPETLRWMTEYHLSRAVIATDLMSSLQTFEKHIMLYADCIYLIRKGGIAMLKWIFCPSHAGVTCNARVDFIAGQSLISGALTLDPPTVLANANNFSNCMNQY